VLGLVILCFVYFLFVIVLLTNYTVLYPAMVLLLTLCCTMAFLIFVLI